MRRTTRALARPLVASALLLVPPGRSAAVAPPPTLDPALAAPFTRPAPTVEANDNRRAAGRLRGGVLTVKLEARTGVWAPDDAAGPQLAVAAFAEAGRPLQTPGPLLRVPAGTEIRASVRNALATPLWVHGMGATRGYAGDSTLVEPGATRELRFRVTAPGTYYYAGRTGKAPVFARTLDDSQLNGAIVVDPPGATPPPDRVFVISNWFTIDTTTVSGLGPHATLAINGRSWPHTERLDATQGDSLHWRLVNVTPLEHPMHLHGFYFRVDAKGDGRADTLYTAGDRRLSVTELLLPGRTMAITWSPERSGNWVFHCHFASHIATRAALESDRRMPSPLLAAGAAPVTHAAAAHAQHGAVRTVALGPGTAMQHHMEGLVLGIRVAPRGAAPVTPEAARPLRLLVRSAPSVYGDYAGYAYVLGGSPAEASPDSLPVPGPTLVLTKGEPVAITIVNESHEPVAVHWHGIELESFPDGVPDWSGDGRTTLPMVGPRDSLTVRFTPPRAGTFMYHSHSNEFQQISSGLYGAIVVVDPRSPRDEATDRVLLFGDDGPTVSFLSLPPGTRLNGRATPDTLELRAGVPHRLRLINIRTDYILDVALLDGERPVEWRVVAKDGADRPPAHAAARPATLTLSPGEIYDVEVTPRAAGALVLRYAMVGYDKLPPATAMVRVR